MRIVGLTSLLLIFGASCTTTGSGRSQVASTAIDNSHFRVAGTATAPATDFEQRKKLRPEASSLKKATPSVVTAAADPDLPTEAAETHLVAFQETPPPPAPNPESSETLQEIEDAPSEPGQGLSLSEAISIALSANPTLPEAVASLRRTQGEWAQSGFYPNPTAGYAASEVGNEGAAGQQGVYFGQTFVTASKLDLNRAVAAGGVAFAEAQAEAQRLRVTTDTTVRFYEALGAQRLVTIAQRIEENASQSLDATRSLYEAGEANRADVLQAQAVSERSGVSVRQAKANADAAWRRLAVMLGQPNMLRRPLVGELETEHLPEDFEAVWLRIRSTSPELAAASARVARTRARISREQAQAVPDVDSQNIVQYDTNTGYAVVGLQWTVPVPINHKNQGSIAAAQAEHVRACHEYQRTELELRDRLAEAFRNIETASEQVETFREKVIPAAEESLELIRNGYRRGEYDVLRLITAQQSYADASAEYVQSLIDLRTSVARVDGLLLTGGLDEPPAPEQVGGFGGLADTPRAE